jgi:hypothetical protein
MCERKLLKNRVFTSLSRFEVWNQAFLSLKVWNQALSSLTVWNQALSSLTVWNQALASAMGQLDLACTQPPTARGEGVRQGRDVVAEEVGDVAGDGARARVHVAERLQPRGDADGAVGPRVVHGAASV